MAMDPQVQVVAERLKSFSGSGERSKTGIIKALLPQIEDLRAKGFTNEQICCELKAAGLEMSQKTFESLLHRARKAARKRWAGNREPSHAEPGPVRAEPYPLATCSKPVNPADLRRLRESSTKAADEAF